METGITQRNFRNATPICILSTSMDLRRDRQRSVKFREMPETRRCTNEPRRGDKAQSKFMDTRQVREYPDSTVLKWRMITTLNRKQLEKQRVYNRFASNEVHIGHFFYNVNATVRFGNRLTLSILRFKIFHLTDWQTDKLTNWQTNKTVPKTVCIVNLLL